MNFLDHFWKVFMCVLWYTLDDGKNKKGSSGWCEQASIAPSNKQPHQQQLRAQASRLQSVAHVLGGALALQTLPKKETAWETKTKCVTQGPHAMWTPFLNCNPNPQTAAQQGRREMAAPFAGLSKAEAQHCLVSALVRTTRLSRHGACLSRASSANWKIYTRFLGWFNFTMSGILEMLAAPPRLCSGGGGTPGGAHPSTYLSPRTPLHLSSSRWSRPSHTLSIPEMSSQAMRRPSHQKIEPQSSWSPACISLTRPGA